jgi:hypothetical protein
MLFGNIAVLPIAFRPTFLGLAFAVCLALPAAAQDSDANDLHALLIKAGSYYAGVIVPLDYAKALDTYKQAAALGDGYAMSMVGVMYDKGQSVPEDPVEALAWFRKGADAGDARAMYNVAVDYEVGRGTDKDQAQAAVWYRKGAEAGDGASMMRLGDFYYAGASLDKSLKQAAAWYQKAVDIRYSKAYWVLAVRYMYGEGVGRDAHKAAELTYTALLRGDDTARHTLDGAKKTDLPPHFIQYLQEMLTRDGFYTGEADDDYGPAVSDAIALAFGSADRR